LVEEKEKKEIENINILSNINKFKKDELESLNTCKIINIFNETNNIKTFTFKAQKPVGKQLFYKLEYESGQNSTFTIKINNKFEIRTWTISSTQGIHFDNNYYFNNLEKSKKEKYYTFDITVKKSETNPYVSKYLHDYLNIGDQLTLLGINLNNFRN
jgi:ferredoxin-NADP reductase